MEFTGTLIIIGSSGLIGKSVSSQLSNYGFDVHGYDLSTGFDISKESIRSKIFTNHKNANYLVNLFGLNHTSAKPILNKGIFGSNGSDIRAYNRINVELLFDTCKDFCQIVENPKSIVNFGSLFSVLSPRTDMYGDGCKDIGYTCSKHAVIGLSKQLASHLAPKTRVNSISPGGVKDGQPEEFVQKYSLNTPMKRMLNADELAGPIAFLCSDLSSSVTGHNLMVDGGWSII